MDNFPSCFQCQYNLPLGTNLSNWTVLDPSHTFVSQIFIEFILRDGLYLGFRRYENVEKVILEL